MRSINIFTDASITKTMYGETIGCSGAILMEDVNIHKYEISRDSTNNISEIMAIKLAVQLALENRDKFDIVNIWSDSQWSIYGLTKWIRSWMNNMENHVMMNSSRQPVKNQQIFLSIMKMIVENNLRVNFYHIKGHVDTHNIKSINHAVSVFNRANNASISRDKIYKMATMNNMVDDTTRKLLDDNRAVAPIHLHRGIVNPIFDKNFLSRYYSLVTLGGNKI